MRCSSKWGRHRFVRILTAVCAIRAASIGLVSASSDETSAVGVSLPLSEVAEIRHVSEQYPVAPLKGTGERITNKERDLKQRKLMKKVARKGPKKTAAAIKKGTKKKYSNKESSDASSGKKKTKTRQYAASGGGGGGGDQTKNEDYKSTRSYNMVVSNAPESNGASEQAPNSTEMFMEEFYNSWDSRGGRKNKKNRGGRRHNNFRRGNKGRGRRRKRQRPGQGWSGGGGGRGWNGGNPVKDLDNWQSGASAWDLCPCTYVDAPSWWGGGSSGWNSGVRNLAGNGSKAGKAYYGRDHGGGGKGYDGGVSQKEGNGGGNYWNDVGGNGWNGGGGRGQNDWNDGGGKNWGGGGGKGMIKVCTCMPTYFP